MWAAGTSTAHVRVVPAQRAESPANAIVDVRYVGVDGARTAGLPTYRTLNAALRDAPGAAPSPWTIRLRAGRYREKVSIDKPNIRLVGAHRDSTVITWADAAGFPDRGGGTLGTRGSWTVRATVADFHASVRVSDEVALQEMWTSSLVTRGWSSTQRISCHPTAAVQTTTATSPLQAPM